MFFMGILNTEDEISVKKKLTNADEIHCVKCPNSEIRSIFPYSVQMRENTDQQNSEYGHFSRINVVHINSLPCTAQLNLSAGSIVSKDLLGIPIIYTTSYDLV